MMSLKLVKDGRTRIYEAASFTIMDEMFINEGYCRQITAHHLVGGEDQCWWIGNPPYGVADVQCIFDAAYIMNSSGKTIEVLALPPNSTGSAESSHQRAA